MDILKSNMSKADSEIVELDRLLEHTRQASYSELWFSVVSTHCGHTGIAGKSTLPSILSASPELTL